MAYMNATLKSGLTPYMKKVMEKYGIRGTISTDKYSITLNVKSGPIDFVSNMNETMGKDNYYNDGWKLAKEDTSLTINPYHFGSHFSGKAKAFLTEMLAAMNKGNWDKSNIQVDYFDVGWYIKLNIGKWNKPYEVV